MRLCLYVIPSFLPSLPAGCRPTDLRIKSPPVSFSHLSCAEPEIARLQIEKNELECATRPTELQCKQEKAETPHSALATLPLSVQRNSGLRLHLAATPSPTPADTRQRSACVAATLRPDCRARASPARGHSGQCTVKVFHTLNTSQTITVEYNLYYKINK